MQARETHLPWILNLLARGAFDFVEILGFDDEHLARKNFAIPMTLNTDDETLEADCELVDRGNKLESVRTKILGREHQTRNAVQGIEGAALERVH